MPIRFNPFTRRTLLQGSAALAATSLLPSRKAFAFSGPYPANPLPTYSGQIVDNVSYTLESTEVSGASLSQGYAGLSLEKSALTTGYFGTATEANQDLVNLYNVLAPNGSVLRLGGGSTDAYKWATSGTEIITQADLNILQTFLTALPKWKILYAVNMGGFGPNAATGHVTTITQASNEVAALYATVTNSQILGIEIGNEVDGYIRASGPWSPLTVTAYSVSGSTGTFTCANKINLSSPSNLPGSQLTLAGFANTSVNQTVTVTSATATGFVATFGTAPSGTYTGGGTAAPLWNCEASPNNQYQQVWSAFYNAIVTQTPSAIITGPATELWGNDLFYWTSNYANYVKTNSLAVAPITQHYYDSNSSQYTGVSPAYSALLYNPYPNTAVGGSSGNPSYEYNWWMMTAGVDGSRPAGIVPTTQANGQTFRISECNSCADGGYPLVSDAYAAALWSIDFALQMALLGNTGCNFHGDQKYAFDVNGNAQTGGNYYSPINDDGTGNITNVQPLFYGLTFLNAIGIGSMMNTTSLVSGLNINTYAVYKAANGGSNLYGGVDLIIVNKDATHTLDLTITAYGTHNIGSALLYQLTQGPAGFSTTPNPAASDEGGVSPGHKVTFGGTSISTSGGGTITPVTLNVSGQQTACYVPLLGAVLIKILFSS